MRKHIHYWVLLLCLTSCAKYQMPPFGTGWTLQGNTVANRDMQVDFGGDGILANASDGGYDLHFITSQAGFNAYDPKCVTYLTDVIKHIPLKIDSIDVIFADQFLILSPSVINAWEPDYVRRADGGILSVQAHPVESLVQPHDQLWRNLVIDKTKRQITVVDRLVKNGRHYAIVYVLQSESKSSPYAINYQFDITNPRNMQSIGTLLEALMKTSVNALLK
ncbi:MAG: hypothetical protein IKX39_06485 [Muribaculaceae bacterium]|nr:hypothetical protein [Muribaculaceae bacterium]